MQNIKEYQPRRFEVIDTSLREGLQSPILHDAGKYTLDENERMKLALALMKYGVRFVEVFSPIADVGVKPFLNLLNDARNDFYRETGEPVFILAHVRCHPNDVDEALRVGVDGLNFYMGTSENSQKFNHGKTLDTVAKTTRSILEEVKRNYPQVFLRFSGEDAFRTPIEDLFSVYDPIVDSVDRLGMPDTVGIATPQQVEDRVMALRCRYPHVPLEGHFHNDRGLALINAMTASRAGVQYIQTSVCGFGERSGITSLTGLLFNLYQEDRGLIEGFNIVQSYDLNVLLTGMAGVSIPPTEPVNLINRTHSAGVHTSAVIKDPGTYESVDLEEFGVSERRLLLGPLSGRHVVHHFLAEVLKYDGVTEEIVQEATSSLKKIMSEKGNQKTPEQIVEELAINHHLKKL